MAETDRKASATLRKKAAPKKQEAIKKSADLSSLRDAFGIGPEKLSTTLDQYGRYILVEMNADNSTTPKYLFIEPNGRDWKRFNGTQIIQKVKEVYKNQDALRKILFDKGFLSENEYNSKSTSALNGAILQAATEFSTEIADSFTTEGKITFPTFQNWITGRGSTGDKERLPGRDIQLYDKDVIKSMVRDVYLNETGNAPDEQYLNEKTNFYMDMIKKGTLTTAKKVGGEYVTTRTPGFSESRLREELPGQIQKERPTEIASKKSLDFLAFLADLGG